MRVDQDFLRSVVERMAAIGSSPLGFRVAGTPEDDATSQVVADAMRSIGLQDVTFEPVPADGWRFRGAFVEANGERFTCASFGGARPTAPEGVSGQIVFAGRGSRAELARRGVEGKIVLFDWPGDHLFWPSLTTAEATQQGAVACVMACLPGGRFYQAEAALGSFDALWVEGSVPFATISKEDALKLIELQHAGDLPARLVMNAELYPGATAHNVAGTLPGRTDGPPIVVAGHQDCWFGAGYDDASGVAAGLGIAKAMIDSGYVPERPIVFGSHTGEEYGRFDSAFEWLLGATWRAFETHRHWGRSAPFYLNIEGSGMPLPMWIDRPPELHRFCRRVAGAARREGLLPYGTVYGEPRTGTEQWPYLAAGIPSLNVNNFARDYWRHEYHTQYDTPDLVSWPDLARETAFYTRIVTEVDANPAATLQPSMRAAWLRRHGRLDAARRAGIDVRSIERALKKYERASRDDAPWPAKRAAFATLAQTLEALHARDKQSTLHLQALNDVEALDAALGELRHERNRKAARAAARVGRNALARHLGREVFALDHLRHTPKHPNFNWAKHARTTPTPNLWDELASLRGERGAKPAGAWIERSLRRHRARSANELERRLARIATAFERAAEQLTA